MIVILTKNSKVVEFYTASISIAENEHYYIRERNLYLPQFLCEEPFEVVIPEDIKPGKYCYTEEKGFYLNPDYDEPEVLPTADYMKGYDQAVLDLLETEE